MKEPALTERRAEDLEASLHPLERKVLPAVSENSSIDSISAKTRLSEVEVRRSVQWLEAKKLCTVKTEEVEVAELDANGLAYRKKQLPERRMLSALASGKTGLSMLIKETGLSEDEISISIGILKKEEFIRISKEQELTFELTETGREHASGAFGAEQQLLQHLEKKQVALTELNDEQLKALGKLRKRKALVKTFRKSLQTATLTDAGEQLQRSILSGPAKKFVEALTPEMLRTGSWERKRFRSYELNAPVPRKHYGKLQPYREFLEEVRERFIALGFEEMTGPIVESEFWNMDALFMPQFHSARDIHDAYYIKEPTHAKDLPAAIVKKVTAAHENGFGTGSKGWRYSFNLEKTARLIMRSQTTACSVRKLASKTLKIPGKYFAIGRCFRYDVIDAKHLADFNQLEGIVAEEGITLRHLIWLLKLFAKEFCETEKVRVVPSYFPFTEPSASLYAKHPHLGWIELAGAGMFRPEMVKPLVGREVPVMAWGIGIDRIAMFRLGMDDIRNLFSHDLDFLRNARMR